jgi:hypothetical protein
VDELIAISHNRSFAIALFPGNVQNLKDHESFRDSLVQSQHRRACLQPKREEPAYD